MTANSPAFLGMYCTSRIKGERIRIKLRNIAIEMGIHRMDGRLEERFSPHCLRHWFTTCLEDTEMKSVYIAELRGDQRTESKDRYHHISSKKLKEEYLKHIPILKI